VTFAAGSWWTADRWLVVIGLVVTAAGLGLAIWQLLRTRRAAEAAKRASEATRATLRSSDLRRAIDTSLEIGRRIDVTRVRSVLVIHIGDWLAAYQRIHALVSTTRDLPNDVTNTVFDRMEAARGEILVARDALDSAADWNAYSRTVLRRVLADYGTAAETVLLVADESVVNRLGH
jgi:hypothetical protein